MGNSPAPPKFILARVLRRHRNLDLRSKSSSFSDYLFALIALLAVVAMVIAVRVIL